MTARERPDVALVGLGESSDHALHLVEQIVHEAACPVIVLIHAPDPDFVKEASKRGVFAYITDADAKDWQSSIDIVLRRFTEYHDLEGAFGRRAVTERAKGILMERHSIDEPTAFPDASRARTLDEPEARGHCVGGGRRPHLAAEVATLARPDSRRGEDRASRPAGGPSQQGFPVGSSR